MASSNLEGFAFKMYYSWFQNTHFNEQRNHCVFTECQWRHGDDFLEIV